ncbi:hypothetical protein R2G56_01200 [Nitratireductor aquimarinus]|uniref:Spore coat protein U domain-containing protein n=1 Tax=Nitratireductor aquimarinus TaxID=889300 RepID=A0ABU4AF74_9HYPH|nr:hypothetical protein [Nitratireductor aquimarinus]MDV6224890.1 hypothetical protein [Nitratireductor aquimarinus]
MRMSLVAGAVLTVLASPSIAFAASTVIPFRGEVNSTCVITVGTPGTLGISGDFTVLSSDISGGVPGTAVVLATGAGYSISTTAPTAFTSAPATGNDNVAFSSKYSATGATSVTDIIGTTLTPLSIGLTTASVDLTATKSAGVFAVGTYIAEVTLTCE